MNEQTEKMASALAITEKKPHRPGGCVGIFFQLFDWNRRFAKKKLFSRKVLPPARSKLHMIADENSGGFPNVEKNSKYSNGETEQKHEMRAPGLVARLMGLESMPAVTRDKSNKKALVSGNNSDIRDEKMLNSQSGANREDFALEKSSAQIESRPQKIQKIEPYDRRVVTRFGAEALQIKSVLSRSKKYHYQKFVSPVKSPRISSARTASRASRLIDAAAKILEPGLQATNRAKYVLAYSSSMHYSAKNEDVTKGIGVLSPDVLKQAACNVSTGKCLMGQTSCNNCGNLLDVLESRAKLEEQPFVCPSFAPNFIDASSQGLEKNWPRAFPSSFSQGKDVIFQRSHDQPLTFTGQEENCIQRCNESNTFRKPLSQEAQAQWHLTSQLSKPHKNEKCPIAFKPKNQTQNHISPDRDRIPVRAKLSNLQSSRAASAANIVSGARDFVVLNRSLSSRTRHRVPIKMDSSPIYIERKSCSNRDDSLSQLRSPVRKRRISVNGQAESASFINSAIGKERNAKCNPLTRREMEHGARTVDRTCVKSRSTSQETGNGAKDKNDTDIISFTFNSPLKQNHGISMELKDEGKDQNDINCRTASLQRSEILEDNYGETSQHEYELKTGCTLPKRSTAMILQELISAFTSEQPNSQNGHLFNSDMSFQTEVKAEGASVGFASHDNHFSTGSVLEASFSNDSCVSSNLDESLGYRLHLDSMDFSYDEPQQIEPDADLLDSTTSLDKETNGNELIEWEMNYSLGKWTDFDIEAYETGTEMDWDILQNLVEEIVVDLVSP